METLRQQGLFPMKEVLGMMNKTKKTDQCKREMGWLVGLYLLFCFLFSSVDFHLQRVHLLSLFSSLSHGSGVLEEPLAKLLTDPVMIGTSFEGFMTPYSSRFLLQLEEDIPSFK